MRFKVETAGKRDPCLERRSSAGAQFGWCGGGGVRYRESSAWYIDGTGSPELEGIDLRIFKGESSVDSCPK